MTIKLKQSTASQEITLGVFVDETDGFTAETGLTIANTDIKLWKMGATTLASKNLGGATHISGGIYYATLDDTDTNTLGAMIIYCHVAGARPVVLVCEVLTANVYDSLIPGTDTLDVNVTTLAAAAIDSILDEPVTEPAGVFAWASATLRNIIGYVGALGSNKITQTATTQVLRNRADGANIASATVSDDGTTSVRSSHT